MKRISLIVLLVMFLFVSNVRSQTKIWIAPKNAADIVNPLKSNVDATTNGKKIFNQVCAICHGVQGKGNGIAGTSLNPRPANFLSITVENESDGAVFWKISDGRGPMASYKTMFTDSQRWGLVNYIRQLEKK